MGLERRQDSNGTWFDKTVPLGSTFANFRNSLCCRKLQIIPHLFMHFPKSKIHKELGHCPDAGYPKMAKVELQRLSRNGPIRVFPAAGATTQLL